MALSVQRSYGSSEWFTAASRQSQAVLLCSRSQNSNDAEVITLLAETPGQLEPAIRALYQLAGYPGLSVPICLAHPIDDAPAFMEEVRRVVGTGKGPSSQAPEPFAQVLMAASLPEITRMVLMVASPRSISGPFASILEDCSETRVANNDLLHVAREYVRSPNLGDAVGHFGSEAQKELRCSFSSVDGVGISQDTTSDVAQTLRRILLTLQPGSERPAYGLRMYTVGRAGLLSTNAALALSIVLGLALPSLPWLISRESPVLTSARVAYIGLLQVMASLSVLLTGRAFEICLALLGALALTSPSPTIRSIQLAVVMATGCCVAALNVSQLTGFTHVYTLNFLLSSLNLLLCAVHRRHSHPEDSS